MTLCEAKYIFMTSKVHMIIFFIFLTGRKGILKTQSGLQIAYLSGVEKSEAPEVHVHLSYLIQNCKILKK